MVVAVEAVVAVAEAMWPISAVEAFLELRPEGLRPFLPEARHQLDND